MNLVLLEQSDSVSIYSIQNDGVQYTEFEQFLLDHKAKYQEDIGTIMYRIDKIKQDGCFERHFRYAGKYKDRTAELPSHFDTADLRVYCIVLSEKILILGNGGVKRTRTYNEDPWLNNCEIILQDVDAAIKKAQRSKKIVINDKIITGDLSLEL